MRTFYLHILNRNICKLCHPRPDQYTLAQAQETQEQLQHLWKQPLVLGVIINDLLILPRFLHHVQEGGQVNGGGEVRGRQLQLYYVRTWPHR